MLVLKPDIAAEKKATRSADGIRADLILPESHQPPWGRIRLFEMLADAWALRCLQIEP